MRILVTSDSHGNYRLLNKAIEAGKPFDTLIFLGDGENDFYNVTRNLTGINTYCVRGNNDWNGYSALSTAIEVDNYKIFLCHGHQSELWQGYDGLLSSARQNDCEIVLFGHTHVRHHSCENGIHLFNPGSVSFPRDGKPRSYGIITDENGELEFLFYDLT